MDILEIIEKNSGKLGKLSIPMRNWKDYKFDIFHKYGINNCNDESVTDD